MEFRVLGPVEVIGPGGPIDIPSARQRAILALLVLNLGETISRERLIDEVWGDDPPPTARHALGVHVAGLRRALGSEHLETQPGGYRLREAGAELDLRRFEALLDEASAASGAGDARAAAARFRAALALWRGPALADLDAEHATRAQRARLDELRFAAQERWIDAELGLESIVWRGMLDRIGMDFPPLQARAAGVRADIEAAITFLESAGDDRELGKVGRV